MSCEILVYFYFLLLIIIEYVDFLGQIGKWFFFIHHEANIHGDKESQRGIKLIPHKL